jgi:hypothetical protein
LDTNFQTKEHIMKSFSKSIVPVSRGLRAAQVLAASALFSVSLCGAAFADPGELDAKLSIARAQASIDMVSEETPAATQDPSFANALNKLADAQAAVSHDENRRAGWLASEAELLADTAAGTAKLADLEHTRSLAAHDLDILQGELKKTDQNR